MIYAFVDMGKYFFYSIVAIVSLFSVSELNGQGVSFTQWDNIPLNINPAFTGFYNGEMRVTGFHRTLSDKGISDINTTYASFEAKPFNNLLLNELDEWAFGVGANKVSSMKGVFSSTNIGFSTAYHKALDYDGKLNLTIGFQGRLKSDRINLNSLYFTSQFDETGFNGALPNYENSQNFGHRYFDFNSGILFSVSTENEFLLIGASAQQVNYAKRNPFDEPKIDPLVYVTFGYTKYINNSSLLNISGNVGFNTPIKERNFAIGYGATITDLTEDLLVGGVYYRFNEVLSPFIQFQKKNLKLTISYDTYVSPKINSMSMRRGLELSAIFRFSSLTNTDYQKVNLGCYK